MNHDGRESHNLSRRIFLGKGIKVTVAAATVTMWDQMPLLAAKPSVESGMRIGLTTYMWGRDWDIPALIENCKKAGLYGVELRTGLRFAHGVEPAINAKQRAEIKKRFADSNVRLVSIASGERMDWPEPERLKAAIEAAKNHLRLSHDLGCNVVRVFPNQFHARIPHQTTIEQIAKSMNELGAFGADWGQEVSLEAHGPVGELPTLRAIMGGVVCENVRVRLNCDPRDAQGKGFTENFNLVKDVLSQVIHLHDLTDSKYPYQLMVNLLVRSKWRGCGLIERSDKCPVDRIAALAGQRQIWEEMIEKSNS